MWIFDFAFVANSEKCRKYTFLDGYARIITILHRGGYRNLLQHYMGGGLPDLLQYYKGEGGVSWDPKFVLRNIWTAPYSFSLANQCPLASRRIYSGKFSQS